jgi:hypothetical protein
MPYVIRWVDQGEVSYQGKGRAVVSDIKRARVFSNMGAVKLSLGQRSSFGEDTEIVELEMKETGNVLLACEVMEPVFENREAARKRRELNNQIRTRERELEELRKLKEKYDDL